MQHECPCCFELCDCNWGDPEQPAALYCAHQCEDYGDDDVCDDIEDPEWKQSE